MLGIVVSQIENNSYFYRLFNKLNSLSYNTDCYIFCDNIVSMPMKNKFAILQQLEALNHDGILIGTSIITSQIVINSLTATKKYYYLWYPEWTSLNNYNYQQLLSIYNNKELKLITRSQEHKSLVQKLFHVEPIIIDNWDIDGLLEAK